MRDERVAAPGDRVHQGTLVRVEGRGVPHHGATFRRRGVEPVQSCAQDCTARALVGLRPATRDPRAARRATCTRRRRAGSARRRLLPLPVGPTMWISFGNSPRPPPPGRRDRLVDGPDAPLRVRSPRLGPAADGRIRGQTGEGRAQSVQGPRLLGVQRRPLHPGGRPARTPRWSSDRSRESTPAATSTSSTALSGRPGRSSERSSRNCGGRRCRSGAVTRSAPRTGTDDLAGGDERAGVAGPPCPMTPPALGGSAGPSAECAATPAAGVDPARLVPDTGRGLPWGRCFPLRRPGSWRPGGRSRTGSASVRVTSELSPRLGPGR